MSTRSVELSHVLLNSTMPLCRYAWTSIRSGRNTRSFLAPDDLRSLRRLSRYTPAGQEKAIEHVELLTKVPEYRKKE